MRDRDEPGSICDFGDLFNPEEAMEPILAKPVRGALLEWLEEIFAKEELAAMKVSARRRAIFDGPPGVGKTTLAHHLSARLGLRMLAVRPERMIHKYLGSTGRNIGALFDAVADEEDHDPVVLFLDEFDAIAMKRKDTDSSAGDEQNAWINTLLQRIEQHKGFIIAATNHGSRIDQAIWRRFDIHITLELPGQFERERIIARYLDPLGLPKTELTSLADSLALASPALIRQLCENLKRQIVVGPKVGWDMRRDPMFDRMLQSFGPHPELGKPRLWSHASKDVAIRGMTWPLRRSEDIPNDPAPVAAVENNVIAIGSRIT
jgi:SpoVK/Ycf46/Vps4 family AAA+-type ATPase